MIAKELIEARWKAVIGAVLGALMILVGVFSYDVMRTAINPEQLNNLTQIFGSDFVVRLSSYSAFIWSQSFSPTGNNGVVLMVVAALIGASLIAGEVSKGSIFLLLSRPLSRENILLTKYGVGAVVLLAMAVFGAIILVIASFAAGRTVDVGGVAVSVLLFWFGTLFVLGISTLYSVLFSDVLRPLAATLVTVLLLSLPALFPNGGDWVLPGYWSSLPAFLGQEFPTKAIVVSLVAAAIPVIVAVPLFKRQAY